MNLRNVDVDLSQAETRQAFQREVLDANCEHAKAIIAKLREVFSQALIDPTALKDIDGWTQDDYRFLWGKVIERYAGTVVFLDGWQYSNGCSYEFLVASRPTESQRPLVLKETLEPLALEEALSLIKASISEMRTSQISTEFLERVERELLKLSTVEELCSEI